MCLKVCYNKCLARKSLRFQPRNNGIFLLHTFRHFYRWFKDTCDFRVPYIRLKNSLNPQFRPTVPGVGCALPVCWLCVCFSGVCAWHSIHSLVSPAAYLIICPQSHQQNAPPAIRSCSSCSSCSSTLALCVASLCWKI